MNTPLAKEKLDKFRHLAHHENSIVEEEDCNDSDQKVSEVVSCSSVDKSVEQQQKDANEVRHELIEDVLVVDD